MPSEREGYTCSVCRAEWSLWWTPRCPNCKNETVVCKRFDDMLSYLYEGRVNKTPTSPALRPGGVSVSAG